MRAITGRIYNKEFKTFFFYCSSIFWQMLLSVCAATQNCILKKNISIQEDHHKVTIADIASWYLIPFAFTTRQNSTKVNSHWSFLAHITQHPVNKIIRVLYTIVYSKVFNRCRCRINKAPVYLLSEFWQNGSALCHNLQNLDDQCFTPVLSKFKEILLLITDIGTCWKLCHFWNTCGFAAFSHGLLWSKSWLYFSVFKSCIKLGTVV